MNKSLSLSVALSAIIFNIYTSYAQVKASTSFNANGSRFAIGYKVGGTNTVVQVYDYNGVNWNQLGENIP